MATRTFTVDTANSAWVYPDGESTTVNGTAETFTMDFTDTGAGGKYCGLVSSGMTLANGDKLIIEGDKTLTCLWHEANGALTNTGSIWASINGFDRQEVKVVACTITDGDGTGANNLASITFEYPGKPWRWTWTNIQMA